ncbi:MAG: site-specific DNA-methyltransferase, partial [Candidatus Paceibacterota bacterium]
YHSNWLNMMYPRLYLARNLLKDDGVIFVSIDDNEVHNLRMIMNEIFGEENFVANIIWQKKYTISNDAKYFSDNHDHILVYGKVKDFLKLKGIPRTEKQNERYQNPDNDPRGLWMSQPLHAKSGNTKSFKYKFENGVVWKPPKGTYPRYSKESLKKFERENRIWLGEDEKSVPRLKKYLEDMGDITPATLWFYDEVGNNDQGNRELKSLDMGGLFSNPKPTKLIKRMLQLSTEKDDVILDFFAGSGSTAHATMEQNVEDRENRKHIMIQLPEETDKDSEAKKSGYENIADIAKERIRRAGKKIKKGKGGKLDFDKNNLDLGFKVFKLSDSNFKQWIREEVKDKEKLQQKLEDSIENLDKDSKEENILFELMLKLGIDPNASVEDKKDYFVVDERELIICLENKITKKIIDRIIEEEPHVFVCLDGAFICNDELKTNTSLQMKSKEIEFKVV